MKAIVLTQPGSPDVLALRDLPDPTIASPTGMLVRVHAAGVNPVDAKLRSRGLLYPGAGYPAVLGCDGAGTVVETGDGVRRFQAGDRVWFCDGGLGGAQGCYAEYKVIEERAARRMPASLDFVEAAAGPLVLITAWEALLDRAGIQAGDRVLIHGGAGGVGHVALQIAALHGAKVIVTVSDSEKAERAHTLGAERAVLYSKQDFVGAVAEWSGGRGVDVALDTVGGAVFRRTMEVMAHYGNLVTLLDPGTDIAWQAARNRNLRIGFELMLMPQLDDLPEARAHQGEILDRCGELIDNGWLQLDVGAVMPLAEAAEAHRRIERGHSRGKIVLAIA